MAFRGDPEMVARRKVGGDVDFAADDGVDDGFGGVIEGDGAEEILRKPGGLSQPHRPRFRHFDVKQDARAGTSDNISRSLRNVRKLSFLCSNSVVAAAMSPGICVAK
jgi:hypothetical protein